MTDIRNRITTFIDKNRKHGRLLSWLVLFVSITILASTSYYVADKSALIHSNNTDQLIDSYMFENHETFQDAIFPAAHSFFLKWPIFALSSTLGNTPATYTYLTVAVYFVTIFGFLYIVYRLARKNNIITALSALSLSTILMFVPAQPADNSYLPVNMAMITTRNLEFLVLFLFIYLAITIKKINSFKLYFAILTLGILGATDKYFLMLALGASVLEIAYRMLYVKVKPDIKVFYPLISSLGGYVFATLLLAAISKLHITGIPDSAHASPFALTTSVWQMIEAFAGAIQGIIVNFGAGFFGKVASTALLPYAINGTILLICCYAIWKLFFNKKSVQGKNNLRDTRWRFVLWLVLVSIASILLFTASNHEFLKDARYLTSILFAGIGALAYLLQVSSFKNKSLKLLIPIILLALVTPILFIFARANFTQSVNANYSGIGERTDKASNILTKEDADLLVSDYWFSAPTKLKLNKSITIVPMSTDSCDTPNTFLTSKNWIDTSGDVDRSAYYILRDAALDAQTYNHGCTMEYLNQKYGPPEKEYVIRGTTQQPIDIIRIYPYDIRTKF